jgi:HlyD family secretion protein
VRDGRPASRSARRRVLWLGVVVVLVMIGGGVAWALSQSSRSSSQSDLVLHEVELGDLSVEVTDRGNLESAKNVEHRCEVEGRSGGAGGGAGGTTILWVIDEGTQVKEGDLLVELDSSNLEDNQKTQKIAYENARSTYEKAKADVDTAKQVIKEHVEGLFIQEQQTKESDVKVAEENLTRAKDSLRHTKNLYAKGFATKEELAAAEFAVTSADLNLKNSETALDVFLRVTKSRQLTELNGDLAAKEAVLAAEETKVAQEKDRLDKIEAQLKKCKIYAKGDGMVVYYVSPQRWGSEGKQIEEGAVVIERQKIIILPDLSEMQVRMLVHESKIDWVREGQPARIRVDAFANKVLKGRVKSVATTPEQGPWYDRDKRNYPVIVSIDEPIEGLKPGMTAETTILVEQLSQVVTLPVQCVRTVGQTNYCYVSAK